MTGDKADLVRRARNGERIQVPHSLYSEQLDKPDCRHHWRVIVCDSSETDVCECAHCGKQIVTACDFDEEYS